MLAGLSNAFPGFTFKVSSDRADGGAILVNAADGRSIITRDVLKYVEAFCEKSDYTFEPDQVRGRLKPSVRISLWSLLIQKLNSPIVWLLIGIFFAFLLQNINLQWLQSALVKTVPQ